MRVLIADDDRVTREILARAVRRLGHEVVLANDGMAAWRQLEGDPAIRVAILDWMMPGFDGIEICRRLVDRSDRPGVYTILLTAHDEEAALPHALASGAHIFLAKPVSLPVLEAHLEVGRRLAEAEDRLTRFATEMEELAEERAHRLLEAERAARTDPLTGALNRRGFLERAESELRRAVRYRRPLAVVGLDLDHFKRVNDVHGHHAGDEVLKAVAELLSELVREGDVVGRIGGEEIEIVFPETERAAAAAVAERIRRRVAGHETLVDGRPVRVTISAGVASLGAGESSLATLLVRADEALYKAKRGGRNRVVVEPGGLSSEPVRLRPGAGPRAVGATAKPSADPDRETAWTA